MTSPPCRHRLARLGAPHFVSATWWVALALVIACSPALAVTPTADPRPLFPGEVPDDAAVARALREFYTKYEYRIPMRDGVKLYTIAYVPKDPAQSYPILMIRTPYGIEPYGADNYPTSKTRRLSWRFAPGVEFIKSGYILVAQDVRGRFMSEGDFVDVRPYQQKSAAKNIDESSDTYDTIEFLIHNVPRNSGKVGLWGISYPGFYAAQGAIDAHPALKAVSPQAPVTDWFAGDDFHHNGALMLDDAFLFYRSFGKPRPAPTAKWPPDDDIEAGDGYDFFLQMGSLSNANRLYLKGQVAFWNDLMTHPTLDAFWQARNPRPYFRATRPAVLTVGGWFDAEDLYGTLETYRSFEKNNRAGLENTLVMGPWGHGGWLRSDGDSLGDVSFGAKTALFFREHILFPFFERHLKGRPLPVQPEAYVFETGTNEWHTYPSWPPPRSTSQTLWLQAGGRLSAKPTASSGGGSDSYLSDPQRPVPHIDKMILDHGVYMNGDQRFAARRPDVLTYRSEELTGDVTLSGPLTARLWVSTTGTDADFIVKLIDVYPGGYPSPDPNPREVRLAGYQQLVRAEVMRGRFRHSLAKPEPFVPGRPTQVSFSLPDVNHTFRPGHRMMVQIQSSWFPLVDRNPQTFVDIYQAKEADFRAATHTVYHEGRHEGGGPHDNQDGSHHASGLEVTVSRGALP